MGAASGEQRRAARRSDRRILLCLSDGQPFPQKYGRARSSSAAHRGREIEFVTHLPSRWPTRTAADGEVPMVSPDVRAPPSAQPCSVASCCAVYVRPATAKVRTVQFRAAGIMSPAASLRPQRPAFGAGAVQFNGTGVLLAPNIRDTIRASHPCHFFLHAFGAVAAPAHAQSWLVRAGAYRWAVRSGRRRSADMFLIPQASRSIRRRSSAEFTAIAPRGSSPTATHQVSAPNANTYFAVGCSRRRSAKAPSSASASRDHRLADGERRPRFTRLHQECVRPVSARVLACDEA